MCSLQCLHQHRVHVSGDRERQANIILITCLNWLILSQILPLYTPNNTCNSIRCTILYCIITIMRCNVIFNFDRKKKKIYIAVVFH